MNIQLLFIDDTDISSTVRATQSAVERQYGLNAECYLFQIDRKYQNDEQDLDENKIISSLREQYLLSKLDVVACDFDLDKDNRQIAFNLIHEIRRENKNCSIILYSGAPLKELTRIDYDQLASSISTHIINDNPECEEKLLKTFIDHFIKKNAVSTDVLKKAFESNISTFSPRDKIKDTILEAIDRPSIGLQIENLLLDYGDMKLIPENGSIDFIDVARGMRQNSIESRKYVYEIIERGINKIKELNNEL